MKKSTVIALLALSLSAAACTTEDPTPPGSPTVDSDVAGETADMGSETGDAAEETGDMAGETGDMAGETGAMSDPVCEDVFGGNVPLAERADTNREVMSTGDALDKAEYGEVNLLKQRLERVAEDASSDQAGLIERINAPFVEASSAVQDGEVTPDEETDEVTLPEIDVEDSAAAQDELEAACQG
ncbi:hypothetical protein [Ornithinimicrobium sediminis]|uniref:hypothetical protein n=1 Tax=Ornithinimicrobium sediminis TaxID=2904603 RepID=UPI001E62B92E|nr:hypothetical protein [Ornithinimicrobium sediminis]MCE0486750.1 hypothetical protein [Ornithinimicrobium sediminis]